MIQRVLLSLVASLLIAAAVTGCGESDAPIPRTQTIDIRNGSWLVARSVTSEGDTSCAPRDRGTTVEIWRCGEISDSGFLFIGNIDPGQGGTFGGFLCTVTQDAAITDSVFFDCTGNVDLGPCVQNTFITGRGTVTDSTFRLTGTLTIETEIGPGGDSLICAEFVDPCTSTVVLSGSFLSTETALECDRLEILFPSSRPVGLLTSPDPVPVPEYHRELYPRRRRTNP